MLAQGKNQPGNTCLLAMNSKTSQCPSLTPATTSIAPTPSSLQHGWHTRPCLPTLALKANTLPKPHHFRQKEPARRNSTCLEDCWNPPQQQTCKELSWQSQEHQGSCRPSHQPSEKAFLHYPTPWACLEHGCKQRTLGCGSATSFC